MWCRNFRKVTNQWSGHPLVTFSRVGNSLGGVQNIFSELLIGFGKKVCTPAGHLSIMDPKEKDGNMYILQEWDYWKRLKNIPRKTTSNKKFQHNKENNLLSYACFNRHQFAFQNNFWPQSINVKCTCHHHFLWSIVVRFTIISLFSPMEGYKFCHLLSGVYCWVQRFKG